MSTYLLEIGTEELPAGYILEAQAAIKALTAEALKNAHLDFETITCLSTPRRLALLVSGLASKQETTTKKVKGPPVLSSFNEDGSAKPSASGFAAKHGLTVAQLATENQGGTEYLVANVVTEGKPVASVLADLIPSVISQLSGERMMRWGSSDFKFSRPIRWLVSLLDSEVIPFTINGVVADRKSFGHRILSPGAISIKSPAVYVDELKKASVLVDPKARQKIIETEVNELARQAGGRARFLSPPLLDEVVNITEWPKAIVGDFAEEYLDLPGTLIETIMVHHQKYFPVEKSTSGESLNKGLTTSRLLPNFIAVANNGSPSAANKIKQGNERVLRARLADGRFFYFDDQKLKLSERKNALAQLTFQEGLGSYLDKIDRLVKAINKLSAELNLDAGLTKCLVQVVTLCKCDLVTNLVRELPELQGHVGAWYAEREGESPDVVRAIASHYAPRFNDDPIPADTAGQFAALIDKTDNLVGLFAIGKKPSGSSDPFALRRQAQGLIDILMTGLSAYTIDLVAVIEELIVLYQPWLAKSKKALTPESIRSEVCDFLMVRVRGNLAAIANKKEVVDAVASTTMVLRNIPDAVKRVQTINELVKSEKGIELIRAGVRIGNILKEEIADPVNETLFSQEEEKQLWQAFRQNFAQLPKNGDQGDDRAYSFLIDRLQHLAKPIDNFFDNVMVNDQDIAKRKNRHALLGTINKQFQTIADFPKLQPLIP